MSENDGCVHERIVTFRNDDAAIRMWACEECRRRFYPACYVCIENGHRSGVHPDEAEAAQRALADVRRAVDVERLARAIWKVYPFPGSKPIRADIDAIAAEYDRLGREEAR